MIEAARAGRSVVRPKVGPTGIWMRWVRDCGVAQRRDFV